jgi:CcmD family protein
MTGVVQGGWEFVIAAYGITGVVLAAYTAWVIVRLKELRKDD